MIITIDGPAGSGKGTIAKFLAKHLSFHYIDTGLLYRGLASLALSKNISFQDEKSLIDLTYELSPLHFDNQQLRTEEIGNAASQISVYPSIRNAITSKVQDLCDSLKDEGLIIDGRDAGTVIYPTAKIKIFITADPDIRLQRRKNELRDKGQLTQNLESLLNERDKRDRERKIAPLKPAHGAYILDTTHLSIDESCQNIFNFVKQSL